MRQAASTGDEGGSGSGVDVEERNLHLLRFVQALMGVFYGFAWALLARAAMEAQQVRGWWARLLPSQELLGAAKYGFVLVSAIVITFVAIAYSSWLWRLRNLSISGTVSTFLRPMGLWVRWLVYMSALAFYPWVVFESFPLVYPLYIVALKFAWFLAAYGVVLWNEASLESERRPEGWTWRPR